jgi:hypothetical protein
MLEEAYRRGYISPEDIIVYGNTKNYTDLIEQIVREHSLDLNKLMRGAIAISSASITDNYDDHRLWIYFFEKNIMKPAAACIYFASYGGRDGMDLCREYGASWDSMLYYLCTQSDFGDCYTRCMLYCIDQGILNIHEIIQIVQDAKPANCVETNRSEVLSKLYPYKARIESLSTEIDPDGVKKYLRENGVNKKCRDILIKNGINTFRTLAMLKKDIVFDPSIGIQPLGEKHKILCACERLCRPRQP